MKKGEIDPHSEETVYFSSTWLLADLAEVFLCRFVLYDQTLILCRGDMKVQSDLQNFSQVSSLMMSWVACWLGRLFL